MKIAFVRARYSAFGGAERFAARALAALASGSDQADDSAIDVAVLARRWSDAETPAEGARPIRFVRCDPFYVGSVWRDASFASAVHRRLAIERFDLVQSHERIAGLPIYRAGDGVHAAWLARRARAGGPSMRLAIAANPHHRYLVTVERAMFAHPALRTVICNSAMVRAEIASRFPIDPSKLVLIRNGVDLVRFSPAACASLRMPTRVRLGVTDDTFVFAMVGSGFERKGVGAAIAALRAISSPHRDAALVVVGADKHAERYVAEAAAAGLAARVRFVGPVDDPLPYYAAADALLAPAIYDPFPNAALEALACGLPLIASDACGVAEIVEHGTSGWVVPATDPDALVDALVDAMAAAVACDRTTLRAMATAARLTAEPHSLTGLSSALMALYRSLLS